MKDLWLYLRARRWHIVLWAINWALFALMARLGGMGTGNVAYTALLSAVCALAVGALDCRQFLKKHRLLQDICRQTRLAASNLPECGANALEQDYQALVRALESDMAAAVSRTDRKMADLAAYYTLWAHQIKTPIAAMRLLLQQDGQENSELGQELFRIEQYVEMALGYVRLDSESTDLLLRRYPLDEVIRPAVRKFAPQFIHKRLTLRYEPGTQTALTDEKWLGFVIEQVLSNAVKYTPSGGRIRLTAQRAGANHVRITVEDNGVGIPADDVPRLFERFYRVDKARSRAAGGTGLGLAIAKEIVEQHEGKIALTSEYGKGTTVTITLPTDLKPHGREDKV